MSRRRLSADTWFRVKATGQTGVVVSGYALDGEWLAFAVTITEDGYQPGEVMRVRFREVEIIEAPEQVRWVA